LLSVGAGDVPSFPFPEIKQVFLAANTPLFLIRKRSLPLHLRIKAKGTVCHFQFYPQLIQVTMKKDKQELSYYGLLLLSYLKESHPQLASDTDFIRLRSESAAGSYADAIAGGYSHPSAEEITSSILYEGLLFSRYDTIRNVLINEFTIVPVERIDSFALELLAPCEEVFAEYPIGDTFASSPEYTTLYTELVGFIDIWREENEL
jgi:hypothetical protein